MKDGGWIGNVEYSFVERWICDWLIDWECQTTIYEFLVDIDALEIVGWLITKIVKWLFNYKDW